MHSETKKISVFALPTPRFHNSKLNFLTQTLKLKKATACLLDAPESSQFAQHALLKRIFTAYEWGLRLNK